MCLRYVSAGECRSTPGFRGIPDVLDWESVGTHRTAKAKVLLQTGVTYFVIVRATTSMGRQVYANSDGVTVTRTPITAPVDGAETTSHKSARAAPATATTNPVLQNGLLLDWNSVCPIDAANRCAQSKATVGQFLLQQYGPPEFNQNSQATQIFRTVPPELLVISSSSSSNRPNGLNFGSIIGIAFGVMGFCVLASCALILVTSFKSKSDKFKTNINRREEMEEYVIGHRCAAPCIVALVLFHLTNQPSHDRLPPSRF